MSASVERRNYSKLPNWFVRDMTGVLTVIERLVWIVLANHADNKTGLCRMRLALIASEVGADERSTRRALNRLDSLGLIEINERSGGHGRASRYWVNFDKPGHPLPILQTRRRIKKADTEAPLNPDTEAPLEEDRGDRGATKNPDTGAKNPDTGAQKGGFPVPRIEGNTEGNTEGNSVERAPLPVGVADAVSAEGESASATTQKGMSMESESMTNTTALPAPHEEQSANTAKVSARALASPGQLQMLADAVAMVRHETPWPDDLDEWAGWTSDEVSAAIREWWPQVEQGIASGEMDQLPANVTSGLSDHARRFLRERLGFLPPRRTLVRPAAPPPSAPPPADSTRERLITELRAAYRAAKGRDLTPEEAAEHAAHDAQVIREDIEGLRYNTPPAEWARPVRFFGGIVEDDTLALLVDAYTLARGYAPAPDRYAQYMSYRQSDALRVIADLTEKLRLDGIAPNAACCTEVYESLSPRARAWADAGGIPENLTEAK